MPSRNNLIDFIEAQNLRPRSYLGDSLVLSVHREDQIGRDIYQTSLKSHNLVEAKLVLEPSSFDSWSHTLPSQALQHGCHTLTFHSSSHSHSGCITITKLLNSGAE